MYDCVCPNCDHEFQPESAAYEIVEVFEDLLDEHGIIIPDEDRTGSEDEASIYGCTYYNLCDKIAEIIRKHFCRISDKE